MGSCTPDPAFGRLVRVPPLDAIEFRLNDLWA